MPGVTVVAKRLKQARVESGLSQKQLGIQAGIDPFAASARINQYERGKHVPDVGTAARLCKVLKVPPPFLYAHEDSLAAWILLFDKISPAARRAIAQKAS